MSIFFAEPLWWLFLAPAALPPLIHLLARRRKTLTLPSIILLQKITREKTLLRRWQKMLLMVLRCAALAALGASFAKPYFSVGGAKASAGDSAVIFLFDVSLSGDFSAGGVTEHETAKIAALEILKRLPNETAVAVAAYSDARHPQITPFTLNKIAAAESISRTATGYDATDHAAGLEAAAALIKESVYSKNTIIWFTDAARSGFAREVSFQNGRKPLLLLASGSEIRPNVWVTGYSVDDNGNLAAHIESRDFDGNAMLSLRSRGKNLGEISVSLKQGSNKAGTFWRATPLEPCIFEIRGDALRKDDTYRFAAPETRGNVKAIIVDGNPKPGHFSEVYYLEAAAMSLGMDAKTVRFYDFADFRLSDFDAVFFSNFWPRDREDEITEYLSGRGRVILFASDAFQEDFSAMGVSAGAVINKRETARAAENLAELMPAAAKFDWNTSVSKYFKISAEKTLGVPMRLDDGTPFIVTDGRFTFVNSSADRTRSDFAVKPAFVPLLKVLLSPDVPPQESVVYGFVGTPGALGDGHRRRRARLTSGAKSISVAGGIVPPIDEPAIFSVEHPENPDGDAKSWYIVNTHPSESDTRRVDNINAFVKNASIYRVSPTDTALMASMAAGRSIAGILRMIFMALLASENIMVFILNKR